jgi:hypothetical protein
VFANVFRKQKLLNWFLISQGITGYESENKRKSHFDHTEITPVLPVVSYKLPQYFEGYLEFCAVCQYFYLFVQRFLAEPYLESIGLMRPITEDSVFGDKTLSR